MKPGLGTGPHPEILSQDVIPMQMHGVNPRSIMGRAAWDVMRKKIYARHGYICSACGTPSRQALFKPYLEAHEYYEIDYNRREMRLIDMEPLCHACHSFVHGGLMGARISQGSMSRPMAKQILAHGVEVLRKSGGMIPHFAHAHCRYLGIQHRIPIKPVPPQYGWSGWKLIWDGREYPSPYPTYYEWEKTVRGFKA